MILPPMRFVPIGAEIFVIASRNGVAYSEGAAAQKIHIARNRNGVSAVQMTASQTGPIF